MFDNLNVADLNDDEMWVLREAAGFYLSIAAERESDGIDPPGTLARAEALAAKLGTL